MTISKPVAAGLKITYRWRGNTYSVIAWSVLDACNKIHNCVQRGNVAQDRAGQLARHG